MSGRQPLARSWRKSRPRRRLHRDVHALLGQPGVIHRDDVRMVQSGCRTRFVEKQRVERGAVALGHAQMQCLDGDRARQDRVVGGVDRAKAAFAELLLQCIATDVPDGQALRARRPAVGRCAVQCGVGEVEVNRRIGGFGLGLGAIGVALFLRLHSGRSLGAQPCARETKSVAGFLGVTLCHPRMNNRWEKVTVPAPAADAAYSTCRSRAIASSSSAMELAYDRRR